MKITSTDSLLSPPFHPYTY